MALQSSEVLPDNTLEEFRIEFNKLVTDVSGLSLGNTFTSQLIFEGATDDAFETVFLITDPTADKVITFPDTTGNVLLDTANITLGDNLELQLGAGPDLRIFHNGSNSIIRDTGTGALFLEGDTVSIRDEASGETMANFASDGAVTLFHNNVAKLATASTGVEVSSSGNTQIGITSTSGIGSMEIGSAASNAAFIDLKTPTSDDFDVRLSSLSGGAGGSLTIAGGTFSILGSAEAMATFADDGAVSLYHNNVVKLATAATGVTMTGEVTATGFTGTLDGILGGGTAAAATTTTLDTSGAVNLNLTTDSTSSTSGALIVDGGVGVAKKLFVGTDLDVDGTANLDIVDIDGAVNMATTALVTGVLTTTATQVATGGITSGSNIVSDTDSTDDLGTTSVRWANLFVDAITTTGEITATGFTGTLDGILGSGTAAAATTTALASTTITASGIIKTDDATAATSTTDGSLQTDGGLSVVLDAVIGDDLFLLSDAPVIHFGANSEVTLTHVHNVGLELKHTATADDTPIVLTLATGETDMAANDVMGKIQFQAPDEGTGTDAILVAAAIQARSEGDFSSSVNTTSLDFMTGASETAATRMTITSAGNVAIGEASTTARLDVHKTSVVAAEISNATNGHFFTAQSDDNTDAFEIYQQHGSNTTRNTFVVTDNHTGSKGESFLVRGDGRVGIGTSAPDSLVEISSGGGTTAKIATTTSNSLAELILEDGNAGYGLQIRSDNAQSLADGAFVINDRDTGSFPFALFEGAPSQSLAIKADANAFAVYVGYKQAVRLRGVSGNANTGEQQFRIEWWNENEAGIMAKIGCNRTDSSLAPGALVFFTSANVDTTANSGEGNITEHFRIAANVDLTGTDTSIGSNSDSRLKKNIQNYSYSLEDFKKYVPKTFDWHNPEKHGNKSNVRGFIAQEVQEIDSRYIGGIEIKSDNPDYNLLTKTEDDLEDEKTALTSALGSKDAMYISVIQQLAEKIEVLEAKMTALEK